MCENAYTLFLPLVERMCRVVERVQKHIHSVSTAGRTDMQEGPTRGNKAWDECTQNFKPLLKTRMRHGGTDAQDWRTHDEKTWDGCTQKISPSRYWNWVCVARAILVGSSLTLANVFRNCSFFLIPAPKVYDMLIASPSKKRRILFVHVLWDGGDFVLD